jgi:hypothetical protein
MNLILYRHEDGQHKFYGMVDVPEKPEFKGDYFLHYGPQKKYEADIESCKSSALEIINPETLPTLIGVDWLLSDLKDGDTFPLPSDLKFQEDMKCDWEGCKNSGKCFDLNTCYEKKVLRLVKVESEESQEELWDEIYKNAIIWHTQQFRREYIYKFTIQRKKP